MPYRPEIDGLRAIAVLSVILFHAHAPALPGGFLGVDIFFVISGFLITGLIARDLSEHRFSLAHFWERRIRRIAPALLATILATTPFAIWLMLPDDLENYGQSVVATLAFSNNILLWLTSGYFALEASFKPLMHSWSLGVEEQYYLLVPLLALAVARSADGGVARLRLAMLVITLSSFGLCLWAAVIDPVANFLMLPTRAWQLGAGALAALHQPALLRLAGRARAALVGMAFAMVLAPLWLLSEAEPLPGLPTLVPVTGAALLLALGDGNSLVGRLLSCKAMRAIGLISYSAYLVHQPVLAMARILSLAEPSPLFMLGLIPAILGLAALSWRFVEQPFRRPARHGGWPRLRLYGLTAGVAAPLLALGLVLHFGSGMPHRFPELETDKAGFGASQNIAYNLRPQALEGQPLPASGLAVQVIGNSFARDFVNMALDGANLSASRFSYHEYQGCTLAGWPDQIRRNLARASHVVLGSGVAAGNFTCIESLISEISRETRGQILIIGLKNFGWNNNAVMRVPVPERYALRVQVLDDIWNSNRLAMAHAAGGGFAPARYVDTLGLISDAQGKVPVFTPDQRLISQDRGHLTPAGARYLAQLLFTGPLADMVQ